jgi:hypothetical protein
MTTEFFQRVEPWCFAHGESEAKLLLSVADAAAATRDLPATIRGALDGPHCSAARTLAAQFAFRSGVDAAGRPTAMAHITDPCFWSPALPFLYRVDLEATLSGRAARVEAMVGLRRWECDGANFRLERKRVVLRGAAAPAIDESVLETARSSETTIIVPDPADAVCRAASRRGVALIADLRGLGAATPARLRTLAWHPAVLVAVLDDRDWTGARLLPIVPAACGFDETSDAAALAERPWARVVVVELHDRERPPGWLAACGKPVIAIRRGVAYADFHQARAACDRLQAELAPEFNLAGYVVAP